MKTFAFEATIEAVVRVQAADEGVARKVISTVLGSPGSAEIKVVNENNAGVGLDATIDDVEFCAAPDLVLLEINGERVKRRQRG